MYYFYIQDCNGVLLLLSARKSVQFAPNSVFYSCNKTTKLHVYLYWQCGTLLFEKTLFKIIRQCYTAPSNKTLHVFVHEVLTNAVYSTEASKTRYLFTQVKTGLLLQKKSNLTTLLTNWHLFSTLIYSLKTNWLILQPLVSVKRTNTNTVTRHDCITHKTF